MERVLIDEIRKRVTGEVIDGDRGVRWYARDQSIFERVPMAVVIPQGTEDVIETLRLARDAGVSVTGRGGGSGTAGGALGKGIVIAFPRNGDMGRILAGPDDLGAPLIRVEPGVLHDSVQDVLGKNRLFLPADPSSGSMCLIGGNIATKASGPHALKHGSIDRYLLDVEVVLSDGTVIDTSRMDTIPKELVQGMMAVRKRLLADEDSVACLRSRRGRKIASGYNLFPLLDERPVSEWVTQLLCGSVGTLGIVTRATLRGEVKPVGRATTMLFFENLDDAGRAVGAIRDLGVAAIEIVNRQTIDIVRERRGAFAGVPDRGHMLLVEYSGSERHDQIRTVEEILSGNGSGLIGRAMTVEGTEEQEAVWKTRKALLPVIRGYSSELKPLSVVNDVGVPVSHLGPFIAEVEGLFSRLEMPVAIYGHAGSGNLHLRPLFDVRSATLAAQIEYVAEEVYTLVLAHDGTITAEHGMGPLRAPFLEREWGREITDRMREIKRVFDPDGILNPGAMFAEGRLTDDLREQF